MLTTILYLKIFCHLFFFPKITLPTRICDTSSTLIDNIFSNVIEPVKYKIRHFNRPHFGSPGNIHLNQL